MSARFIVGDVHEVLATMPDQSVDLVLTSPPFLALRSYLPADHPDKHKEIGSEATPADFLDTLLELTEEWGRVLAPHGSIAVELGDTYAGSGGAGGDYDAESGLRAGQPAYKGSAARKTDRITLADGRTIQSAGIGNGQLRKGNGWPLDKSLTLIPGLYAASLAYGRNLLNPEHTFEPWRVRNLVAWVRPNPPVGALGDKVRPATSYLTWATRARDRWFDLDAVRQPYMHPDHPQVGKPTSYRAGLSGEGYGDDGQGTGRIRTQNEAGAPPLDWWKISPNGYSGAHYATWPEELCRIPIEASCPRRVCTTCGKPSRRETAVAHENVGETSETRGKGRGSPDRGGLMMRVNGSTVETLGWSSCGCPGTDGIRLDGYHTGLGWRPGMVLDPFGGSGTTALVATGRGRDCTLIDLDARNADLARERLGMFLDVVVPTTEGVA